MNLHTPGPWTYEPQEGPKGRCLTAQVFGPDGTAIMDVASTDPEKFANANASLAAAAPALLKSSNDLLCLCLAQGWRGPEVDACHAAIVQAYAAEANPALSHMDNPESGPSKTKLPVSPDAGGGPIYWRNPTYEGDRHLAMCGSVTVGAVFPPIGVKHWCWRVWFGATVQPWEGKAKTEEQAKAEVIVHFLRFLEKAGLQTLPNPRSCAAPTTLTK